MGRLFVRVVVMVVVIVRMGVGDAVVGVLMRVLCAWGGRVGVGVIVVPVVVGVLVGVSDSVVGVGVRMLGHGLLLGDFYRDEALQV
jgi:hypothetical protein